jgi:hypothetical protein
VQISKKLFGKTRSVRSKSGAIRALFAAVSVFLALYTVAMVEAAGPADEVAIRNAWSLYTQQRYVLSADAFEALVRNSSPSSRLYYYAAAANKAAGRLSRAKQLCDYVSRHFSTSPESSYVQKLFPPDGPVGLPEHLKDKSVDELMESEEGRQALMSAVKPGASASIAAAKAAPNTSKKGYAPSKGVVKDTVFSADMIGIEGAEGITQFDEYPDAGFESVLAAMAMLTRGREILAEMITCPSHQDIYIVRFPNSSSVHTITPAKMEEYGVKDKALWATLIHCAYSECNAINNFEDEMTVLTGSRAEKILAHNTTQSAVAAFIAEAVSKQYPIVCLSADHEPKPKLVMPSHAYTITGYDGASGMVTLRNPHGNNSKRFRLETDPSHKKFEQLNDGMFKMHISLFPTYMREVVRSKI